MGDAGTVAVIVFSVFLAVWYGAGYLYNRTRGETLRHWLEEGLNDLGGEWRADWIGSPASGMRAVVARAAAPFRRLEFVLLLANREMPFLWLLDYLRGRQDRLIINVTLRSPRRVEMEVKPGRPTFSGDDWVRESGPHGLTLVYRGREGRKTATALKPWLEFYGRHLQRLIWRKKDPHIQIQLKAGGLLGVPGDVFIEDLRDITGTGQTGAKGGDER